MKNGTQHLRGVKRERNESVSLAGFLTRSLAFSVSLSLVLTAPGTTAWADAAPKTADPFALTTYAAPVQDNGAAAARAQVQQIQNSGWSSSAGIGSKNLSNITPGAFGGGQNRTIMVGDRPDLIVPALDGMRAISDDSDPAFDTRIAAFMSDGASEMAQIQQDPMSIYAAGSRTHKVSALQLGADGSQVNVVSPFASLDELIAAQSQLKELKTDAVGVSKQIGSAADKVYQAGQQVELTADSSETRGNMIAGNMLMDESLKGLPHLQELEEKIRSLAQNVSNANNQPANSQDPDQAEKTKARITAEQAEIKQLVNETQDLGRSMTEKWSEVGSYIKTSQSVIDDAAAKFSCDMNTTPNPKSPNYYSCAHLITLQAQLDQEKQNHDNGVKELEKVSRLTESAKRFSSQDFVKNYNRATQDIGAKLLANAMPIAKIGLGVVVFGLEIYLMAQTGGLASLSGKVAAKLGAEKALATLGTKLASVGLKFGTKAVVAAKVSTGLAAAAELTIGTSLIASGIQQFNWNDPMAKALPTDLSSAADMRNQIKQAQDKLDKLEPQREMITAAMLRRYNWSTDTISKVEQAMRDAQTKAQSKDPSKELGQMALNGTLHASAQNLRTSSQKYLDLQKQLLGQKKLVDQVIATGSGDFRTPGHAASVILGNADVLDKEVKGNRLSQIADAEKAFNDANMVSMSQALKPLGISAQAYYAALSNGEMPDKVSDDEWQKAQAFASWENTGTLEGQYKSIIQSNNDSLKAMGLSAYDMLFVDALAAYRQDGGVTGFIKGNMQLLSAGTSIAMAPWKEALGYAEYWAGRMSEDGQNSQIVGAGRIAESAFHQIYAFDPTEISKGVLGLNGTGFNPETGKLMTLDAKGQFTDQEVQGAGIDKWNAWFQKTYTARNDYNTNLTGNQNVVDYRMQKEDLSAMVNAHSLVQRSLEKGETASAWSLTALDTLNTVVDMAALGGENAVLKLMYTSASIGFVDGIRKDIAKAMDGSDPIAQQATLMGLGSTIAGMALSGGVSNLMQGRAPSLGSALVHSVGSVATEVTLGVIGGSLASAFGLDAGLGLTAGVLGAKRVVAAAGAIPQSYGDDASAMAVTQSSLHDFKLSRADLISWANGQIDLPLPDAQAAGGLVSAEGFLQSKFDNLSNASLGQLAAGGSVDLNSLESRGITDWLGSRIFGGKNAEGKAVNSEIYNLDGSSTYVQDLARERLAARQSALDAQAGQPSPIANILDNMGQMMFPQAAASELAGTNGLRMDVPQTSLRTAESIPSSSPVLEPAETTTTGDAASRTGTAAEFYKNPSVTLAKLSVEARLRSNELADDPTNADKQQAFKAASKAESDALAEYNKLRPLIERKSLADRLLGALLPSGISEALNLKPSDKLSESAINNRAAELKTTEDLQVDLLKANEDLKKAAPNSVDSKEATAHANVVEARLRNADASEISDLTQAHYRALLDQKAAQIVAKQNELANVSGTEEATTLGHELLQLQSQHAALVVRVEDTAANRAVLNTINATAQLAKSEQALPEASAQLDQSQQRLRQTEKIPNLIDKVANEVSAPEGATPQAFEKAKAEAAVRLAERLAAGDSKLTSEAGLVSAAKDEITKAANRPSTDSDAVLADRTAKARTRINQDVQVASARERQAQLNVERDRAAQAFTRSGNSSDQAKLIEATKRADAQAQVVHWRTQEGDVVRHQQLTAKAKSDATEIASRVRNNLENYQKTDPARAGPERDRLQKEISSDLNLLRELDPSKTKSKTSIGFSDTFTPDTVTQEVRAISETISREADLAAEARSFVTESIRQSELDARGSFGLFSQFARKAVQSLSIALVATGLSGAPNVDATRMADVTPQYDTVRPDGSALSPTLAEQVSGWHDQSKAQAIYERSSRQNALLDGKSQTAQLRREVDTFKKALDANPNAKGPFKVGQKEYASREAAEKAYEAKKEALKAVENAFNAKGSANQRIARTTEALDAGAKIVSLQDAVLELSAQKSPLAEKVLAIYEKELQVLQKMDTATPAELSAIQESANQAAKEFKIHVKETYGEDYRKAVEEVAKSAGSESSQGWFKDPELRKTVLEKVFKKSVLSEAEALAFGELLVSDPNMIYAKEGTASGLQAEQIRMIIQNFHNNIGVLGMGGGKTFVYVVALGMDAVMGNPVNAHLIVSQTQEIGKFINDAYVDKNGKTIPSSPYRNIMQAMGIEEFNHGHDLFEAGKSDHYSELSKALSSTKNTVTVFDLGSYGHLARARKEPANIDLRRSSNLVTHQFADEGDVGALSATSFNTGIPKPASLAIKQDVLHLYNRLSELGLQYVPLNEWSSVKNDPQNARYTISPEGIVYNEAVHQAATWKKAPSGELYAPSQIEDLIRGVHDYNQRNVVSDVKGELSKTSNMGDEWGTKDQSDFYSVAAKAAELSVRKVAAENAYEKYFKPLSGEDSHKFVTQEIMLTDHGTEATLGEAISGIGGRKVKRAGGSGTYEGAEEIGEAMWGATRVVSMQAVGFEQFPFTAQLLEIEGDQRFVREWNGTSYGERQPIEEYVAAKAIQAMDEENRGYLGIFESRQSLKDSVRAYIEGRLPLGDNPDPEVVRAREIVKKVFDDVDAEGIHRLSRRAYANAETQHEQSLLDRLDEAAKSNKPLAWVLKGVEILDRSTDPNLREDGIAKRIGTGHSKGEKLFAAYEKVGGRALDSTGYLNVFREDPDNRADLLQELGRGGRTRQGGERYDTYREVSIDVTKVLTNAKRYERLRDFIDTLQGDQFSRLKKQFGKLDGFADHAKLVESNLKDGTLTQEQLNRLVQFNASFELAEKASGAARFKFSSEPVTKLAKEPLGYEIANSGEGSPVYKELQKIEAKRRKGGYNQSRNTYDEGQFRSPLEVAHELLQNGLEQAERIWRDVADNAKIEKLDPALHARALERIADIVDVKGRISEILAAKDTANTRKSFADIDVLRTDIAQEVVEVTRKLLPRLLPSESRSVSMGDSRVVMESRSIIDKLNGPTGSGSVSEEELNHLVGSARQAIAQSPALENKLVQNLALISQGSANAPQLALDALKPYLQPISSVAGLVPISINSTPIASRPITGRLAALAQTGRLFMNDYREGRTIGGGFWNSVGRSISQWRQPKLNETAQFQLAAQQFAINPASPFINQAIGALIEESPAAVTDAFTNTFIHRLGIKAERQALASGMSKPDALAARESVEKGLTNFRIQALEASSVQHVTTNGQSSLVLRIKTVTGKAGKQRTTASDAIALPEAADYAARKDRQLFIELPKGLSIEDPFTKAALALQSSATTSDGKPLIVVTYKGDPIIPSEGIHPLKAISSAIGQFLGHDAPRHTPTLDTSAVYAAHKKLTQAEAELIGGMSPEMMKVPKIQAIIAQETNPLRVDLDHHMEVLLLEARHLNAAAQAGLLHIPSDVDQPLRTLLQALTDAKSSEEGAKAVTAYRQAVHDDHETRLWTSDIALNAKIAQPSFVAVVQNMLTQKFPDFFADPVFADAFGPEALSGIQDLSTLQSYYVQQRNNTLNISAERIQQFTMIDGILKNLSEGKAPDFAPELSAALRSISGISEENKEQALIALPTELDFLATAPVQPSLGSIRLLGSETFASYLKQKQAFLKSLNLSFAPFASLNSPARKPFASGGEIVGLMGSGLGLFANSIPIIGPMLGKAAVVVVPMVVNMIGQMIFKAQPTEVSSSGKPNFKTIAMTFALSMVGLGQSFGLPKPVKFVLMLLGTGVVLGTFGGIISIGAIGGSVLAIFGLAKVTTLSAFVIYTVFMKMAIVAGFIDFGLGALHRSFTKPALAETSLTPEVASLAPAAAAEPLTSEVIDGAPGTSARTPSWFSHGLSTIFGLIPQPVRRYLTISAVAVGAPTFAKAAEVFPDHVQTAVNISNHAQSIDPMLGVIAIAATFVFLFFTKPGQKLVRRYIVDPGIILASA